MSGLQQFLASGDFLTFTLSSSSADFPIECRLHNLRLVFPVRGVLILDPEGIPDNSIVVSCGIHGNETAPIELVNDLVTRFVAGKLAVRTRTMFIIGNPEAIKTEQRFIDTNLNRLFCGKHQDPGTGLEGPRAAELELAVRDFFETGSGKPCHYDLHTAIRGSAFTRFAIYPFLDQDNWDEEQLTLLANSGIEAVLLSHKPASTFSYYSTSLGAHAFTLELGKVHPFGQNNLAELAALCDQITRLMGSQPTLTDKSVTDLRAFRVVKELIRTAGAYQLNVADDVPNFTSFEPGTRLTEDSQSGYQTRFPGEAIVFPNPDVPLGQRTGLMVAPTTLQFAQGTSD